METTPRSESVLYVVKRRRTFGDVEVTSVITIPMQKAQALDRMNDLNTRYQNPGNYYIERWKEGE